MIEVKVDTAALSKLIDDLGEGFDDEVVEAMAQEILDGADQSSARRYRRAERIRPRRGTSGRGVRRTRRPPDHARPRLARLATRATAPDRAAEVKRRNEQVLAPYTRTRARKGTLTG